MEEKQIMADGNKHLTSIAVVLVLATIASVALCLLMPDTFGFMLAPILVAVGFTFVESIATVKIWQWVATKHLQSLPTFYTAQSGFRVLAALATLLVEAIIVGRDAMAPYVIAMLAFYIVFLAIHSLFFKKETEKLL